MTVEFKRAVRENVALLIGLAGTTGTGKTYSALKLAEGISGGKPFAFIDTEARRGLHYAEQFHFDHADMRPPFTPAAYAEAITAADAAGYPVIVVDSLSHEHEGDGGLLDMQEEELQRMAGNDWAKRERCAQASWIKPKRAHKRMMSRLLQIRAHLILCLRAEDKLEQKKNKETGKTEFVAKETLSGFKGWIPICEKRMPFELTASFILVPERPGYPVAIKLQEQHRALFPLDQPIDENAGRRIAEWAAGGTPRPAEPLISLAQRDQFVAAVTKRAGDLGRPAKELALLILGLHELDNSKAIPQRLWLEVMHTIETFGAESSAQADA